MDLDERNPPSPEGEIGMNPASQPGDRAVGVSLPHIDDTGVMVPAGLAIDKGVRLGKQSVNPEESIRGP